jgi:mono/diheme cytochrome c family protein
MAFIVLAGCGGRTKEAANSADTAVAGVPASRPAADEGHGAMLYRTKCSFCHQSNGLGVERTYPPLVGSSRLLGDPAKLVHIILNGMQGPIVVKGVSYDNAMPGWRNYLSPADIAAVLNHARASWGNKAPAIAASFVDSVQRATASQPDPITEPGK